MHWTQRQQSQKMRKQERAAHVERIFAASACSVWAKRAKVALDVLVMKYDTTPRRTWFTAAPAEVPAQATSKATPEARVRR